MARTNFDCCAAVVRAYSDGWRLMCKPAEPADLMAAAQKGEIHYYEGVRLIEHRAADFTDTRPADYRATANAPWPSGGGDGEYLCICSQCSGTFSSPSKRSTVCLKCAPDAPWWSRSNLTEAEIEELRAAGKQPLRLNTIPPIAPKIATAEPLTAKTLREAFERARDSARARQAAVDQVEAAKAMVDQVCGMPKAERKHVSDAALRGMKQWPAFRCLSDDGIERVFRSLGSVLLTVAEHDALTGMANEPARFGLVDYGNYVLDRVTGKRYVHEDRYERLAKRIDDMQGDPGAICRARAEALLGPALDDRLLVEQLCDLVERLRAGNAAAERFVFEDFNGALLDTVTGKRYVRARAPMDRGLRRRAEALTGSNFTDAAPDDAVILRLCDVLEAAQRSARASQGSAVAELDAENARLRRELAAMRIERDNWAAEAQRYAGNADYWRERNEGKPGAGHVTRIEPFPEPAPRSDSWPPPSHKPRMLP